jgi:ion channel
MQPDAQARKFEMKSFIVELWASIFGILRRISILYWVRKLFESKSFIELWVVGNLLLAGFVVAAAIPGNTGFPQILFVAYGAIRVFETIVDQVNVLLFDEYRARKAGRSYAVGGFRRIIILLLHSYVEIMLWYALFYLSFNGSFEAGPARLQHASQAVGYSFNSLTTFGYADTAPLDQFGHLLVLSESVIGLYMTLVILARFIALLPSPETLDQWEKR